MSQTTPAPAAPAKPAAPATPNPVQTQVKTPVQNPGAPGSVTNPNPVAKTPAQQGSLTPGVNGPRVPTKQQPGLFEITSIQDPQQAKYLNMLIYGKAGVGKTTLYGSAVDVEGMRDVLIISAEGGNQSLEDNERVIGADKIDTIRLARIEQLQKIFEFLQAHVVMRDRGNMEGLKKLQDMTFAGSINEPERIRMYRTVIIDSLTEIEFQNMNAVLGYEIGDLGTGEEINIPGYAEFRKNNNMIQRTVRSFRDLPINCFIVCAESWIQDEMKRQLYSPQLTGKLSGQIQGFVDVVGYMMRLVDPQTQKSIVRLYVQTVPTPKFDAKCRRAACKKAHMDNPTMLTLMKDFGYTV